MQSSVLGNFCQCLLTIHVSLIFYPQVSIYKVELHDSDRPELDFEFGIGSESEQQFDFLRNRKRNRNRSYIFRNTFRNRKRNRNCKLLVPMKSESEFEKCYNLHESVLNPMRTCFHTMPVIKITNMHV